MLQCAYMCCRLMTWSGLLIAMILNSLISYMLIYIYMHHRAYLLIPDCTHLNTRMPLYAPSPLNSYMYLSMNGFTVLFLFAHVYVMSLFCLYLHIYVAIHRCTSRLMWSFDSLIHDIYIDMHISVCLCSLSYMSIYIYMY